MMYDFYPATFAVVYGVILFVLFLIRKFTRRRRNPFIFSALFALYLQCLFKFTMLPILVPLPGEELSMTDAVPWTQFIPFHWLFNGELNMRQIVGNFVLLIPLAFFIRRILGQQKRQHIQLKTFLCCSAVSAGIEVGQLLINVLTNYPNGVMDIDDFILNCAGAAAGVLLFGLLENRRCLKSQKQSCV